MCAFQLAAFLLFTSTSGDYNFLSLLRGVFLFLADRTAAVSFFFNIYPVRK